MCRQADNLLCLKRHFACCHLLIVNVAKVQVLLLHSCKDELVSEMTNAHGREEKTNSGLYSLFPRLLLAVSIRIAHDHVFSFYSPLNSYNVITSSITLFFPPPSCFQIENQGRVIRSLAVAVPPPPSFPRTENDVSMEADCPAINHRMPLR